MKSQCILAAVAVAFLCAVGQPIMSQSTVELAKCVSTITNNTSTRVNISGYKFRCPGQIIVAEENEARALPNSSNANAYFKGALIHERTGTDDRVKYFVVVENWADPQKCSVLVGPMTINGANVEVGQGSLSGSWENVAKLLVTKLAYKWADSFEYSRCKRGVSPPSPLRRLSIAKEGSGPTSVFVTTGTGFTPDKVVIIKITAPNLAQLQFPETAGADGKFVSRNSVSCISGGTLTFTAFEDASPQNTQAAPVVTTCP